MGKLVAVHTELVRVHDGAAARWEPQPAKSRGQLEGPKPVGWVVGFRWLLRGRHIPGTKPHWGIDSYDYGDPPEFKETGPRTPCLLVAYWPTMTPVKVPLDGYTRVMGDDPFSVPVPPARQARWSDRDRELYREFAAEQPRDAKGRFKKVTKSTTPP